jgi:hypothetical protein
MSKFIAELMSGTQLNSAFARQPLEQEKPDSKSDPQEAATRETALQKITKQRQATEMSDGLLKLRRETAVGVTRSLKL